MKLPPSFESLESCQGLVAVKMHRQDELLTLMKKMLSQYEHDESLKLTLDDYGSIEKLVEIQKSQERQNRVLRAREMRFAHDPLLKRRYCL